jgi:hypothetical protein
MSKVVQWKRGNVTVNDTYTGANGEITVDTTNWNLRVHDGSTAGGYTIESSSGGTTFSNITVTENATVGNLLTNVVKTETGNLTIGTASYADILQFNDSSGRVGFNTAAWDANIGFDWTFGNNSVFAREYTAQANFAIGYAFDTEDGDTGLSHAYADGNISYLRIRHAGEETVKFFDNNHSEIRGNLVITEDGSSFGTFPNAFVQMYGNVDSYQQLVNQNLNNGSDASTDIVATAGNGDDNSHYIDMGIASNTYAVSGFDVVGPNDGYLYVAGASYLGPVDGTANLNLGSTTGSTRTWAGQGTVANIVTTVSKTGFTVNKGAFVVAANSAPAANNSTGVAGTIAWDSDFIYVCVATDTWKRANLSTW